MSGLQNCWDLRWIHHDDTPHMFKLTEGMPILNLNADIDADTDNSFGDLTTTSPTILSQINIECLNAYLARGVKFNVSFEIQGFLK